MRTTEIISRNEFDKSYLLVDRFVQEDTYIFKMLTQNRIPGIPECKIRYLDENIFLAYDVTGKKPLERSFSDKKMCFSDITELFYGIRKIMHSANDYLLDREGFLLQPKYMFTDLETGELSCLYYLPMDIDKPQEKYRSFADFLLDRIDHKDEHAVNIAYHFYKISKEEYFSFDSFIGFMEKESLLVQVENQKKERERKEESKEVDKNELIIEEDFCEKDEEVSSNCGKLLIVAGVIVVGIGLIAGYWSIPVLQEYPLYSLIPGVTLIIVAAILLVRYLVVWYQGKRETMYEEPEGPVRIEDYFEDAADDVTVFFDQDEYLTLKWKEGHFSKEYVLEEFPVTVGKMQSSVQMVIDDASVSRLHARFRKQGSAIYLQDLDSTNGTYVNEKQLAIGEENIIKRGDEIQFGKIIVNVV